MIVEKIPAKKARERMLFLQRKKRREADKRPAKTLILRLPRERQK